MYKKIAFKVILLFIVLVIINAVYSKWFYEDDIQQHSDIINLVRDIPNDADIIYVGESSNNSFRRDDLDKRYISAFVGDYFPELNTYDITKPAAHAGIYKVLLENIPLENQVKTVIVTLNLRSFNANWIYSDLETPLQKSLVLIKPYPPLFNRFLLSFKAYDIKSESEREEQFKKKWKRDQFNLPFEFPFQNVIEWDYWMANYGIKDSVGNIDYKQTELACHYIKTYGFQLDTTNNPRIKDFNDIIKLAHKRGWNLVFNLLAENTEKAQELIGDELVYMINENAKILENYFQNRGVIVVNNLNVVEDEQFIDQDWTTEHYAEKGRKIVAKNVAEALKTWYKEFYVEVNLGTTYHTNFFNSCDNSCEVWEQMHTITSELAYSGNKSSRTGTGNDFSITWEYPLKVIPDSLKQNIAIELMLNQKSLNHDAKLIIEAHGSSFNFSRVGFDVKDDIKEVNQWVKYSKTFTIPDSIKQADLMKIYIYNPSREKIYVDDFRIVIK
jgi:hypothetical protein